MFEAADRFRVEMLTNGFISVFDRGPKTTALFNRDGSFRSGAYSKEAEQAARRFINEYENNPLDPRSVPQRKGNNPINPYDKRFQPSKN